IAVSVLQRLLYCLLRDADGVLATTVETLSGVEDLLVLGVGGNAPLYACHIMNSLNSYPAGSEAAAVGQKILHDLLGIGLSENHRATCVADELVGTLDHAMALAGSGGLDLAGTGDLEPLLCG